MRSSEQCDGMKKVREKTAKKRSKEEIEENQDQVRRRKTDRRWTEFAGGTGEEVATSF